MSNIETIAAQQRTWSEARKATTALNGLQGTALDPTISAGPAAITREVETKVIEEVEGMSDQDTHTLSTDQLPTMSHGTSTLGTTQEARPPRTGAISIVPAKHAGFIVVDGASGTSEILACASTPEEALSWAAKRLASHQFVPVS